MVWIERGRRSYGHGFLRLRVGVSCPLRVLESVRPCRAFTVHAFGESHRAARQPVEFGNLADVDQRAIVIERNGSASATGSTRPDASPVAWGRRRPA